MSTIEIKEIIFNKNLICKILGHRIVTTRKITNHIHEYKCSICALELTNDDGGNKTNLTPELKDINETLMLFYRKKMQRVQSI